MWEFIFDKVRVQYFGDIVRLERMKKGKFCDADTFFVPDRSQLRGKEGAAASQEGDAVRVSFGAFTLVLPSGGRTLTGARLERAGRRVWKYRRLRNSGELPPPGETPEVFALSDTPRLLLPKGGYAFRERRNSGYRLEENAEDVYLLLCEKNAAHLRRLYVTLTGRPQLVRLSALGLWDSRYFAYDEAGAKERILAYARHGLPLDNIVIDTDWRAASDRGIGYDVDTKLFPDLDGFFAFAHENGVEVMFNDHPEPVAGAKDLFDPAEVGYREEKLQGLLRRGLDTWWYDRNWHTKLISPSAEIAPETLGLYLFSEITRTYYERAAGKDAPARRPQVMGNVSNVANGRYDGEGEYSIRDSASHRYFIQWTGDIASGLAALGQEVATLVRAGADCIPYLNADCGGHAGDPDAQTYLRWIQFGAFSPVLRPHCTKGLPRSREPWAYGEETLAVAREYILMRYRLLPLLYSLAHESYKTGIPMFRALGFEYPEDRRACRERREYLLGKEILVAPVAEYQAADGEVFLPEARSVYLPKGKWVGAFSGKVYAGGRSHVVPCPLPQMPLFVRCGALIPLAENARNTRETSFARLAFDFYPSEEAYCEGKLVEDDGETVAYEWGEKRTCAYFSRFDRVERCHVVTLEGGRGSFAGERACADREVLLRIHLSPARVARVRVNGEDVPFEIVRRDASAYPFSFAGAAPDSDVLLVRFGFAVSEGAEVAVCLK